MALLAGDAVQRRGGAEVLVGPGSSTLPAFHGTMPAIRTHATRSGSSHGEAPLPLLKCIDAKWRARPGVRACTWQEPQYVVLFQRVLESSETSGVRR